MTIVYTPEGGSGVTLAGAETDVADGPEGLDIGTTAEVETVPVVRSAYPFRAARGNRLYSFRFRAKKKHASYEAAVSYSITHIAAFNNIGSCVITQGSATLTLTKASVTARCRHNGATTEWDYSIDGIKT